MNETPVESVRTVSTLYYKLTHRISEILFVIYFCNCQLLDYIYYYNFCHYNLICHIFIDFFIVSTTNTIGNRVQDSQEDLIMSSRPNDINDKKTDDDAAGKCVAGLIWVVSIILICCTFPFSLCVCVRMVQVRNMQSMHLFFYFMRCFALLFSRSSLKLIAIIIHYWL